MKMSLIYIFMFLFATEVSFAGGDNGNGGGGGPSIILRTLDDTDIRIISGGHWEIDEFDEDILVIDRGILDYSEIKLEVKEPSSETKWVPVLDLIDRGSLKVEEKTLDYYFRKSGLDIRDYQKKYSRFK
jgi:hypothetical protein